MRTAWLLCRTSRVSPSRTETTGLEKSNASTTEKVEMKKPTRGSVHASETSYLGGEGDLIAGEVLMPTTRKYRQGGTPQRSLPLRA